MSKSSFLSRLRQKKAEKNAARLDCVNCVNPFTQFTQLDSSEKKPVFSERVEPAVTTLALPAVDSEAVSIGLGVDTNKRTLNPMMSQSQFDEVHAVTWTDSQIEHYQERFALAICKGVPDDSADHFAELLVWRDMTGDNRRACAECAHYRHRRGRVWGRCTLPNGSGMSGGRQEFFRLRRCDGFLERLRLTG